MYSFLFFFHMSPFFVLYHHINYNHRLLQLSSRNNYLWILFKKLRNIKNILKNDYDRCGTYGKCIHLQRNIFLNYELRFHDEEHANLLNSMWLTAITFLCVGYGDIVPNTYCGRGITLTCGMVVSIPIRQKILILKILGKNIIF